MPNRSRHIADCVALLLCCPANESALDEPPQKGERADSPLVPHQKVHARYNAGLSR